MYGFAIARKKNTANLLVPFSSLQAPGSQMSDLLHLELQRGQTNRVSVGVLFVCVFDKLHERDL